MKYSKGWSTRRGQATHLVIQEDVYDEPRALCGAPIRIWDKREMPYYKKSDPRWELCDRCEAVRRKRAAEGRRKA